MIKTVFKIVGYVLATASVIAIVWQIAVFSNNSERRDKEIQSDLKKVIASDSVKSVQMVHIINRLDGFDNELSAVRRSYTNYVKNDSSLTKTEFINIMEELFYDDIKKNSTNKDDMIASDK